MCYPLLVYWVQGITPITISYWFRISAPVLLRSNIHTNLKYCLKFLFFIFKEQIWTFYLKMMRFSTLEDHLNWQIQPQILCCFKATAPCCFKATFVFNLEFWIRYWIFLCDFYTVHTRLYKNQKEMHNDNINGSDSCRLAFLCCFRATCPNLVNLTKRWFPIPSMFPLLDNSQHDNVNFNLRTSC